MKVTIIGSYKDDLIRRNESMMFYKNDNTLQEIILKRFHNACIAIGITLAREGHHLIVAHPQDSDSAEALTLAGFISQETARFRYKKCTVHPDDPVLKAHLDAVEMSDAVILIGGANATLASGLSALRQHRLIIPITGFGGATNDLCKILEIDDAVPDAIRYLDFLSDQDSFDKDWEKSLTDSIKEALNQYPKIVIIHGRGNNGEELRNFIVSQSISPVNEFNEYNPLFGISTPLIMNLAGSGAVTITSVFEELASEASAAIAILTADDIGGFARKAGSSEIISAFELQLQKRARENIWIEVGWFWGRLGREKIFLWLKDMVEIPSDLQGVALTETEHLQDAWKSIKEFLIRMRR